MGESNVQEVLEDEEEEMKKDPKPQTPRTPRDYAIQAWEEIVSGDLDDHQYDPTDIIEHAIYAWGKQYHAEMMRRINKEKTK